MAHHKSAKKRIRSDARKTEINRSYTSAVRTAMRAFREAATGEKPGELKALFTTAQSLIAKAAGKGLMHKNNASRKISRLSALMVRSEKGELETKATTKGGKKKKASHKAKSAKKKTKSKK